MIKALIIFWKILTKNQKKTFFKIQLIIILSSIIEIISISSIIPVVTLIFDINAFNNNPIFQNIISIFDLNSKKSIILFFSIFCLLIFFISLLFSMYATYRAILYGKNISAELGIKLYANFLNKNIEFHFENSSISLTKKLTNDIDRIAQGIIDPILLANSKIALVLFISTAVFIYNPLGATLVVSIFATAYSLIYFILGGKLKKSGDNLTSETNSIYKLLRESLALFQEIELFKKKIFYFENYSKKRRAQVMSSGKLLIFSLMPRYIIEMVVFGGSFCAIVIILVLSDFKINDYAVIMSVFIFAGLKIMPAIQQVYFYISTAKGNLSSLEFLKSDFIINDANQLILSKNDLIEKLPFNNSIRLKNVSFEYESNKIKVIKNINLEIPKNKTIALIGQTGSGKTTIANLILGFLNPTEGKIFVDDVELNNQTIQKWQNNCAYVPQNIFLTDDTISKNISLGEREANPERLVKAIKMSSLENYINNLRFGINTKVGDDGVRISGGQRQRIAIARALYFSSNVLVLDEATSSLDQTTENSIIESIKAISGKVTIIIIAHRINTIKYSDKIYVIDKGMNLKEGTFEEIIKSNDDLKTYSLKK